MIKVALSALFLLSVAAAPRAQETPQNADSLKRGWARTRSARPAAVTERSTTASSDVVRRWAGATRGVRGIKVEPTGVPGQDQVTVAVDPNTAVAFRNILFKLDSTELADEASERQIAEIARAMRELPNERFLVEGHTCDLGTDAHNKALSEQRAEAICVRLVRDGVAPGQLTMLGFGESDPAIANTCEENRQQNRRVMVYRRD